MFKLLISAIIRPKMITLKYTGNIHFMTMLGNICKNLESHTFLYIVSFVYFFFCWHYNLLWVLA